MDIDEGMVLTIEVLGDYAEREPDSRSEQRDEVIVPSVGLRARFVFDHALDVVRHEIQPALRYPGAYEAPVDSVA